MRSVNTVYKSNLYTTSHFYAVNIEFISNGQMEEEYRLNRYHAVGDEYDPAWDLEGLEQSIGTIFSISSSLANSQAWPNWYEGNEFKGIRDASRAQ